MKLSAEQITVFLLSISILLFFAKLFGEFCIKLKQPAIIGEILAGIILGPTVLGMISPSTFDFLFPQNNEIKVALDGITTLSVVMLLLVSGIEVDLSVLLRQGKTAFSTSIMGIIFPFFIGFTISYFAPNFMGMHKEADKLIFALFIGTALSISALPVIAKTLMDLKIFKTPIGLIIISAAMLDDFMGWLIFSIILGMIGAGSNNFSFPATLGLTVGFVLFMLLIGRKIFNYLIKVIQEKFSFPGTILNFLLISGFLGACFTEYIGIHAVFGAFIVGIASGDSVHLKERTKEILHQFVTNIFAPLFFVTIGLKVNFITHFNLSIVLIIIILAFAGKVIGCGIGARMAGMNKNDSLVIGFGMNSRGAMEIILGILAFQFGVIRESVFVALVVMALFTSTASAPFMSYFMRERRSYHFSNLLTAGKIIFTNLLHKEDIISELASLASRDLGIDKETIVNEVIAHEKEVPTGISNYLAIPHARIGIKKPAIALAVNNTGIDFEAPDGKPSRIIILLLTPVDNNELQLQLLSEIVKKFRDPERVEELLAIESKDEFVEHLLRV